MLKTPKAMPFQQPYDVRASNDADGVTSFNEFLVSLLGNACCGDAVARLL